jgi:hypothetical protein
MKKFGFFGFVGIVFLVSSCETVPGGLTQYQQFSRAFSDEINKAKANINIMSNYVVKIRGPFTAGDARTNLHPKFDTKDED